MPSCHFLKVRGRVSLESLSYKIYLPVSFKMLEISIQILLQYAVERRVDDRLLHSSHGKGIWGFSKLIGKTF